MNAKRQLAFLCHPYHRGGVTRWMVDAAANAASAGHTVWFVTVQPSAEFGLCAGFQVIQIRKPTYFSLNVGEAFDILVMIGHPPESGRQNRFLQQEQLHLVEAVLHAVLQGIQRIVKHLIKLLSMKYSLLICLILRFFI